MSFFKSDFAFLVRKMKPCSYKTVLFSLWFSQVQCWDSDVTLPQYIDKQFNISVLDVNEPPSNIQPLHFSIAENLGPGAVVRCVM